MRKTLTKKSINGNEYYYLQYRKKGSLISEYLGNVTSKKYKRYLFKLISQLGTYGVDKAKAKNYEAGMPVVYVEEGHLVYEYKNGAKEFFDSKMNLVKTEASS